MSVLDKPADTGGSAENATPAAPLQGVFGNPLAEPGVIGISSGAVVGAVASIAFGLNFLGNWTVSAFAFAAGLGTVLLVYVMSRSGGRTEVVTPILTGIAVNAFAGALIGLRLFFADTAAIQQITGGRAGRGAARSGAPRRLRARGRGPVRGRPAADGPPGEVFTERLLSGVYDQPVEVLAHPRTGAAPVTPKRNL